LSISCIGPELRPDVGVISSEANSFGDVEVGDLKIYR